jgi:hypothetical protein
LRSCPKVFRVFGDLAPKSLRSGPKVSKTLEIWAGLPAGWLAG